jgi:glutathione peroxidase-family protein
MKKTVVFLAAICFSAILTAQKSPVDDLFDKYSDRDGFTVVSISSKMLGMFSNQESDDKEAKDIINRLKSIRILSVEDSLLNKGLNFYSELSKKMNFSDYEELMAVKEGPNVTKFLVRQKGDVISELLVITGGPGGNSLISIRGDLNLKSLSQLSKDVGIQELKQLDELEKNKPKK